MKKLLSVCSMALLTIILVIFFAGCSRDGSEVTYSLDKSEFNAVVEYNSSFSLDGLNILAQYDETTEIIPVTESMLVDTPDTSSVGTKQITIDFIGRIFVLTYEVKYKVEFVSQGETISTQYVLGIDELQIPAPTYGNYIFEGWLPQIPSDIIDNSTFTALFADGTSNVTVPALRTLNATYGDTLGGIELPSNVYGEWRFVGSDSDTVGNVGTNVLDVEFVLKANGEVYKQDSVSIKVAKRELEFKDMTLSFVYDGEEHFPTYTLDADVKVNVIEGKPETEAGNYSFALWIDDKNYSGEYEGSFEITKPKATITINSYEIFFGESIPDVEYTVTGADESLLGIELVLPEFANLVAGQTYEITAKCSNTNFDVTVNPGTLTVKKNVLDLKPAVIGNAIYGNDISTLTFEPAAEGYWTWENETAKIDTPTSFTATAVFVPFSSGYESIRVNVTVPVAKRQVSIEILESTFVYDGKEHTVIFKVMDGDTDITDECEVIGAPSATNAIRTESYTLEIVSDKYTGSAGVILTIEKAVPECDFTTVTFTETWRRTLTLGNLNLPEGYSWVNASEAPAMGTDEYDVKFTPEDTENYATVNGKISVTVEKASGAIRGVNNSYTSTYNGEEYVFDGIFGNHTESELVYTYELSGNAVDSIKNAGVYTVTITLPETEHYTSDTQTTTVTIGKRLMDYTVGNKTATYGDTLGSIDISELSTELGAWVWQDGANTQVGNAGTNEFVLNFVPEDPDNYEALSFNVNVTVGKRLLTFAIIQSAFMYDTTEHTVLYKLVNDDVEITGITVDGNIVRTDVCRETVVLSVNDANYYGDTTVTFEIVASDKYIPTPLPDFTATYGDALSSIELPESEDGVWTWNDANLSVGNAGTKKFGATFTHNNPNYTPYKTEVVVIVSKAVVEVPTLDINSFVYNREVQKPEITVADDALYMLSSNIGGRNVGTYYVALELKDSANYKWSTTTESVVNIPYEITMAQAEISNLTIEGWTYLENAKAPTATTTFGTIIYTYYNEDGTLIGTTAPTAAGKYYVKAVVEETANYYGTSDTHSFEIAKLGIATPTITNNHAVYNGSVINPEFAVSELYTASYAIDASASEFEIVFTLTEKASANYKWIDSESESVTVIFTVDAAEVVISGIAVDGWTYGEDAKLPVASTNQTESFFEIIYTYYDINNNKLDGVPTVAGTYYVVATVADDEGGNYTGSELKSESFTIAKKAVTVPEITNNNVVFDNTAKYPEIAESPLYTVTLYGKNGEEADSVINSGSYKVVLTLTDSDNYEWSDTPELTFTVIGNVVNSWTTAPSITGWTYNETASVWAAAAKYGNVKVEYKLAGAADSTYTTTVPTNAGNYVARFTVAATDDYGALSTTVSFEIAKAEVEVPTLGTNSFVYTGELQMPEVTIPDGALYSLNANAGGTTVGTYYVVFELLDSANYKWSANDTATVSVPYEITKASNEIKDLAISGWTYGESANAPTASAAFGTIAYTYSTDREGTYTANHPTNAGTYYVKASVAETTNYAGAEAIFEFVIEKQGIATPTFTNNNAVYTGSAIIPLYDADTRYSVIADDVLGIANANTYEIGFTLTDTAAKNYKWQDSETNTVTAEFTVAKAQAEISNFTISGWTYNGEVVNNPFAITTFGSISYTYYKADGTKLDAAPTDAGTYYVVASVEGTDDYDGASAEKSFTISKATVTVPEITNKQYNGNTLTADISSNEYYTVEENNGGVDKGDYDVVLKLRDAANYKWSDGDDTESKTLKFSIVTAVNSWTTAPSILGWTYNETASVWAAVAKYGDVTVEYKLAGAADSTYTTTVPTNAGNYVARFTVAATDDYGALSTTVSFEIAKAEVEVPTLGTNSFVYTGELQMPEVTIPDGALYSLNANAGGTTVGTYYVVFELLDSANYKWSTTDEATVSVPYEITKASNEIKDLTIGGWTYGESANAPTASAAFGTIAYTYSTDREGTYTANRPTNAGTYYVKASVAETINYAGAEAIFEFVIEKQGIATPTFTNNGTKYTGSDIVPEYALNSNYTVAESDLEGIKNAKSYEISFTLTEAAKENYKWIDSETDTVVASFTVAKAQAEISDFTISGWTYDGTMKNSASANTNFGTVTIIYYDSEGNVVDAPTLAGNYTVVASVEGTDDYDGASAEKSFTISKATVTVPEITNNNVVFDNTAKYPEITESPLYTVTLYGKNGEEADSVINSGRYKVVLTLTDSDNYEWSDTPELTFTVIGNVVNSWTTAPSITGWTYNETASVWAAAAKYGNVTVEYKLAGAADSTYTTTVPTNAGNYVARFTVAATDDYGALSTTVSFEVAKVEVEVPTLGTNSFVYTGELQMPEVTIPDGALYSLNANAGGTTVGTYYVVFELLDSANYKWSANDTATVSVPYEITKASNEIKDLTIGGWTYGESANAPTASAAFGTIAYTYSTDREGTYTANQPTNAGTYYVKASVAETANYAGAEAILEFVIEKQGIATPTFTNNNTSYTGNEIFAEYTVSTLYTASGDAVNETVGVIGAGTYDVIFTLTDTVNYKWQDSETTSVTAKFTVAKAENTITSVTVNGWTYGDGANSPVLVATDRTGAITYTYYKADGTLVGTTAPTAAGSYYVAVSIAESDNYLAAAEAKSSLFTVDKAPVTVPTLSTNSFTYNGDVQSPAVTIPDGALYSLNANAGGTTVGTYYVVFELNDSDNYKWSTTDEATVSVPYTITKGTNSISNFTITEKIPYGTAITPSASSTFGKEVIFTYSTSENGEYTETVPTNVGTYYVKATVLGDGVNYDTVTTAAKTFEITKAAIDKPTVEGTLTYTGSDLAPQVNKPGYYTAVITKDGVTVDSVIAVGSYKVVITLTGNCDWKEGGSEPITLEFDVVKGNNVITGVDIKDSANLTYTGIAIVGDDIFNVAAKNPDGAKSYTYYDSNKNLLSGAPINAGIYYVVVTIGESDNYNSVTMAEEDMYEFEIAKATPEITVPGSIGTYYENITNIEDVLNSSVSNVTPGSFAFTIPEGPYTSNNAEGIEIEITVTFTPTDTVNYEVVDKEVTFKLYAVAYVGSTYYSSIESALANTNSGEVWVIPNTSGSVYIKGNNADKTVCTIPSGITLVLPYSADGRNTTDSKGNIKATLTSGDITDVAVNNIVKLAEGVTLTVNGTLEIAGELSGGTGGTKYSGHTAGMAAQLIMENNSKLDVYGAVKVCGFIEETSANNSAIILNNGAAIYQPFVLRDFRGGTLTAGVNNAGDGIASVFNRFIFMNVTSTIEISYGARFYGIANLYASSQMNSSTADMIGITDSSIIQLTDATYSKVVAKYDKSTDVTKLDIYGGAETNGLSLTVAGVSVNTKEFAFAISYQWDINLYKAAGQTEASYTMGQLFKLMPGAKLTVHEGVTLTVFNINIYPGPDSWTDSCLTGTYPTANGETLTGGILTVYGKLIATNLGGLVYITDPAKLTNGDVIITNKTSTTKDIVSAERYLVVSTKNEVFTTLSQDARIYLGSDLYIFENNAWVNTTGRYVISFNSNGGGTVASVYSTGGVYPTLPTPTRDGFTFDGWYYNGTQAASGGNVLAEGDHTLTAQWTENASSDSGCVTPDTLITLADGTQVRVDELTGFEELLVWNMETGMFDKAPIMFIDSEPMTECAVIKLVFSDGTFVKVIYEHGFWDYDLNKYVYLDENAADYIGHTFAKQNGDVLEKVELVDVIIETEMNTAWSPVTAGHLCYFVNGMLSMPGGVGGLFNIFEVDSETMTYDYVAMEEDIAKYGLFTYEELNAIAPLSEDMFNAAGGAYLKVSIGKGNLTMEELVAMINRYSKYF